MIEKKDILVRVGKNGLTPQILEEIEKNLRKHRTIKVKMLKSFIEGKDKKQEAENIASLLKAKMIDRVGMVVTLYK